MRHGKVFEADLIEDLRKVFHYQVEVSSIEMDRKEKIDFRVSGRTLSLPMRTQVTEQSDDGDKLAIFLRQAWFNASYEPTLYVIAEGKPGSMLVAQAMHRAFWRDLAGAIEPKRSYALWVTDDGTGSLHDPKILARDLILQSRAKTANSLRRRGRVVDVRKGLIIIERAGKKFFAPLSSVVRGTINRFTSRKRIEGMNMGRDVYVTFLPAAGNRAEAVKIGKRTPRRQQEKEL